MTLRFFRLLLWVHWRSLLARVRGLRRRSPLLPFVLISFVLGYLLLGYFLFWRGLEFMFAFPVVGALLSQRILFLIFGLFFVMLVFSNLIIGYSTLFKNRETNWFLTLPIAHEDVFRWKFLEGAMVASWALIFLSAPMMAAFGRANQAELAFYAQTAAVFLPFAAIPAALGVGLGLLLVFVIANRWATRAVIATAALGVLAAAILVHPANAQTVAGQTEAHTFDALLRHTRFSLNAYLPSAWMARAVVAWSGGLGREGAFYFGLLLSNALLGGWLAWDFASRWFYVSWTRAFSHRSARSQERSNQRRRLRLTRSPLDAALRIVPRTALGLPMRALLIKDARVFCRDPAQWTQALIFFGLLSIYVMNLRNVAYDFRNPFWATMTSYLNLTACALTLSTLTTRFVFPQFSLEGRRLWILGLAPLGLDRVVAQKFWTAFVAATAVTMALVITSGFILKLALRDIAYFAGAIALMSAALCGLAVGIGALFPNFKEDNPSKIVSGFGGTLCLVASFLYIVIFIAALAFPASLPFTWKKLGWREAREFSIGAHALALTISALATGAPLLLARRRVKNMEF